MRRLSLYILCLALLSGCQTGNVASFWDGRSVVVEDIAASEEQFAEFASAAAKALPQDALHAMDVLFDKLKEDPVDYFIYAEWMDAFYDILSPCRSALLYGKAVERLVSDGILTDNEYAHFQKRLEWMQFNTEGSPAMVPGCSRFESRTLVLVLDLGCPSCREALEKLGSAPEWNGVRKIAVGLGNGPQPSVSGWEYLFPENGTSCFDIHTSPIYFVVAPDGTVEKGYTSAL